MRRAAAADADAIARIHTRTWQAAYEHVFGAERLAGIDPERRRSGWERAIGEGVEAIVVAEAEGRVVAFASAGECRDDPATGELYAIYSLPEAWGTGAGPALMRAVLEALRERGHSDAVLWVLEDNPRARRFYEREGWALDGARKEDDFLGIRVPEVRYRISL